MSGLKTVTLHTDGGCQGNPGPGGWGVVLQHGSLKFEFSGAEAATTNNRMELAAAIAGLRVLNQSCEVTLWTDSQYVKNGIETWIHAWKKNGWKGSKGEDVINREELEELDEAQKHLKVTYVSVCKRDLCTCDLCKCV